VHLHRDDRWGGSSLDKGFVLEGVDHGHSHPAQVPRYRTRLPRVHIGLIVGIGPAATDFYYRSLISRVASAGADLDLTMVHADTPTLLRNQAAGAGAAQVAIYERLTRRLLAAGAQSVAVTSIAGHFCIQDFKGVSVLPVIDLLSVVREGTRARGYRRVGLLGTKGVMKSGLYGALNDVATVAPSGATLDRVHTAYVEMATTARCTDEQRAVFFDACRTLVEAEGVDAVLLAGTDLALAFGGCSPGFPVFDCAEAHIEAIAEHALRRQDALIPGGVSQARNAVQPTSPARPRGGLGWPGCRPGSASSRHLP